MGKGCDGVCFSRAMMQGTANVAVGPADRRWLVFLLQMLTKQWSLPWEGLRSSSKLSKPWL